MKCEYDKAQLMNWINNEMTGSEKEAFENHLSQCPACVQELKAHQYIWSLMDQIPVPEPSDNMQPRFQQMLDTFKGSVDEKKGTFTYVIEKIRQLWILQPRLQLTWGIVLIVTGIVCGYLISHTNTDNIYKQQIDSLSSQIHQTREMMMLSLLDNPSASERIRGVSYTSEINGANKQVVDALLTTLNNDPNVNVRLMTLDALTHFAGDPGVREGLVQSIVQQESPLVQSAMADVMLKLQEKRSIRPFKKLLEQKELNLMVRTKIEQTINRLI